jgi:beta-N-acetylhexosaminidase
MARVDSGLERWLRGEADPLPPGSRIGLLAHPASVDASARSALERIHEGGRFRPVRLFAPEHGFAGREQDMERVRDSVESSTGLPVVSLYGESADSLRPRAEDLEGLDPVVCDLQDVGSRCYTFAYTLAYVMEAARDAGVAVVVLDRPNPLGGATLEGPVLDPDLASFVGRYPLPVRHGMTIGELARLFNGEFGISCDLRVVEMRGWRRAMSFEETGLPWVPPSPNMPTTATARVYPGGCLVEGTNLSEGRGTTTPFELVGAPWLDGERLAAALRGEGLEGVRFRPASFRPMFQKHAGQTCLGVQVIVDARASFRPFATYLALIREARSQAPEPFAWRRETYEFESSRLAIDLLLGRSDLRPRVEAGASLGEMERLWEGDLRAFRELRRPFLLYD